MGVAMFDRISRSWTLAGQCWDVLKADPALIIFPLLSFLALTALLATFALPIVIHHGGPAAFAHPPAAHADRLVFYAQTYVLYVFCYFIVMFFNSALIAVALQRLEGEPATVGDGFRAALSNLPAILGYALIAATVGMILRGIEERVGIVGRIVTAIIGAAWTLATAMTLPVLVVENVGPIEAISRSLQLLRSNWGENLIGSGGISAGIAIISIPFFLVAFGLMMFAMSAKTAAVTVLATLWMVVTVAGLALLCATLHAIYIAALYRFATGSEANGGIGRDLLAGAFQTK
jgi:hypothetical protein